MAAEDWFPWDYDDEEYYGDEPRKQPSCRYCGSRDVYWAKDANDRWVLYGTNSRKHVCKKGELVDHTDAFDDIT